MPGPQWDGSAAQVTSRVLSSGWTGHGPQGSSNVAKPVSIHMSTNKSYHLNTEGDMSALLVLYKSNTILQYLQVLFPISTYCALYKE